MTSTHANGTRPASPRSAATDSLTPPVETPTPITEHGITYPTQIRLATVEDLPYVIALSKKFSNQIGFLPRPAVEWYLANNRVTLALENGDPCGFLLGRTHHRWQRLQRPITQAAIALDAQRRHHGLALVQHVIQMASLAGQSAIQCMVRDDLESNEFWAAAGFVRIGQYDPKNTRNRPMNCMRRLVCRETPSWFYDMPPVAGWKGKRVEKAQPKPVEQLHLFNELPHHRSLLGAR